MAVFLSAEMGLTKTVDLKVGAMQRIAPIKCAKNHKCWILLKLEQ